MRLIAVAAALMLVAACNGQDMRLTKKDYKGMPIQPDGEWRIVGHGFGTSTCIGSRKPAECTIDTLMACFVTEKPNICGDVAGPTTAKVVRQRWQPTAPDQALGYKVVDVTPIAGGNYNYIDHNGTDALHPLRWIAGNNDYFIDLFVKECWGDASGVRCGEPARYAFTVQITPDGYGGWWAADWQYPTGN